MVRRLFGTDGVRGVANTDPMTVETALAMGQPAARINWSATGWSGMRTATVCRPAVTI